MTDDSDRTLSALAGQAGLSVTAPTKDPTIAAVAYDSRQILPHTLFCCVRGELHDGHDFAGAAVAAGAVALVVERPLPLDVPQLLVPNARLAMGHLAAAFHRHPARQLTMVGITGTNGKTTTAAMLSHILLWSGSKVATIGTLSGTFTTPESVELQALLAREVNDGTEYVVMEVSSHALALHRVAGCRFRIAMFTNLGHDHLDFHHDVDDYFAAKVRLFESSLSDTALVNADDPYGQQLIDQLHIPLATFARSALTDIDVTGTAHGYRWRGHDVRVPIGGAFNVDNSHAALEAARLLGVRESVAVGALAELPAVPGRFEPVVAGQSFDVIVDFAHTPDGLAEALVAARSAAQRRVIVVFGCGGDRDPVKRPEMGEVAARLADQVIVTSDNPRSEDPLGIVNAIVEGVGDDYRSGVVIEPDRRRAIAQALAFAAPGDLVLIAGKGHERTQTIGSEVLPFDDRAVALELLEQLT
jgi:UDP-N-acetylmuramoyl-L-alanyl-D-glutamate--2,6-diaminopimelate ligase